VGPPPPIWRFSNAPKTWHRGAGQPHTPRDRSVARRDGSLGDSEAGPAEKPIGLHVRVLDMAAATLLEYEAKGGQ